MSRQRVSADGGMETSYGYQTVEEGEKQRRVNAVFDRVAPL